MIGQPMTQRCPKNESVTDTEAGTLIQSRKKEPYQT